MLEWRLHGLYQHSIHSNIAVASWLWVRHVLELRSSSCMAPQNDSIIELSKQSPTDPIDGTSPAARTRCPNAHEVYCEPWSECGIAE